MGPQQSQIGGIESSFFLANWHFQLCVKQQYPSCRCVVVRTPTFINRTFVKYIYVVSRYTYSFKRKTHNVHAYLLPWISLSSAVLFFIIAKFVHSSCFKEESRKISNNLFKLCFFFSETLQLPTNFYTDQPNVPKTCQKP